MSDEKQESILVEEKHPEGPLLNLKRFQKAVHANAVAKGFWEKPPTFLEALNLVHSELSEATEEFRKGKKPTDLYFSRKVDLKKFSHQTRNWTPIFDTGPVIQYSKTQDGSFRKPEGPATELADALIRILDMAEGFGIENFEEIVLMKYNYNLSRSYMHDGKTI